MTVSRYAPAKVEHGPLKCNRCWQGIVGGEQNTESGRFKMVHDPGYWGNPSPSKLVLGITKGFTQSDAMTNERNFDEVAFKGCRPNLLAVFKKLNLCRHDTIQLFNKRFSASEHEFGFASAIRCSLTGKDKNGNPSASSTYVYPAFQRNSEAREFVSACTDQYIGRLSEVTKLVLMCGITNTYIEDTKRNVLTARGEATTINNVAYYSRGVLFVHITHPSGGNREYHSYMNGEGDKLYNAVEAVKNCPL